MAKVRNAIGSASLLLLMSWSLLAQPAGQQTGRQVAQQTAGQATPAQQQTVPNQPPQTAPVSPAPAQGQDIRSYIKGGWDTLSRSMTDCHSFGDIKTATPPILYLPQDMAEPPEVKAMKAECKVDVEHLPKVIHEFGDLKEEQIKSPGLLYLPNRYVVPGGRFNEMYGWDSYFIILGLIADGRVDLARGMVDNFFFEIEHYGGILNANRTYYFTRSQPPFLTSMIFAVYNADVAREGKPTKEELEWLDKGYSYAKRDHAMWMREAKQAGDTGLQRYWDDGEGPVPEQADDSTYYPDVIRWLLAHPDEQHNFLVSAPDRPNAEEAAQLAQTSCDPRVPGVCSHAHVDGHWLTRDFYKGDRAMRESGFDTSFRFLPFSGATHHYAPVCLNSLLYKYERDLAEMARTLGKKQEAEEWEKRADARHDAVNKYLWRQDAGMYMDYDFMAQKPSSYDYIATFYPLWAGLASRGQAAAVVKNLGTFEKDGGLAMSDNQSGTQWDLPYGWAPTNWLAVEGLDRYGYHAEASRIAQKFRKTVEQNFERDGTIREKYNVVSGTSVVNVAAGYHVNVVGFGWTNGVYLKMGQLLGTQEQHASGK